jgi:hypothetical protein
MMSLYPSFGAVGYGETRNFSISCRNHLAYPEFLGGFYDSIGKYGRCIFDSSNYGVSL